MAKKSFKIKGNLAEALGDTVSSAKNNAGELHIEIIPLRKISLDPDNPRDLAISFEDLYGEISPTDIDFDRKNFDKETLNSLTKSIKEQGIINPIVVYKHNEQYRLIAGERRTLASIMAGKEDIPAKILTKKPDPLKLSLIQWIENIEREDLSLWERIRNLDKIVSAYADNIQKSSDQVTPTELSQLVGCSLQQAINYCHILNASDDLMLHIKSGEIKNIEKAALIVNSPEEAQSALIQACINGATLSELKKISRESPKTPDITAISKNKTTTKINFGFTKNPETVKTIINVILEHKNFQHLSDKFNDVSWNDHRSVSIAFRQLIKLLEHV